MKKVVILLLCGLVLIGLGGWWYLQSQPGLFNSSQTDVPAVQELSFTRDSVSGKVLLATETGLQLLDPETGVVTPLAEGFSKITAPTMYWSEARDGQYWLFMTQREDEYQWYVVNWPKQLLQSLQETLTAPFVKDKLWYSVVWGEQTLVGGAFVAREQPAVALQPHTLATLDLANLDFHEFGVVSAIDFDLVGMKTTPPTLFMQLLQTEDTLLVSKTSNSVQTPTISQEGGEYLTPQNSHGTRVARYNQNVVELVDLTDLETVITTIAPLSGRAIGSTQWWSSSGEIFALSHFSQQDPYDQVIVFYTTNGSIISQLPVTGSTEVILSADGTQAVLASQINAAETNVELGETGFVYQWVAVYSAETEVISTFPENMIRVLGVL